MSEAGKRLIAAAQEIPTLDWLNGACRTAAGHAMVIAGNDREIAAAILQGALREIQNEESFQPVKLNSND